MHRRESILQAVTTALTGLTTTGANVSRIRPYAISNLPALTVQQGDDVQADDLQALGSYMRQLTVEVVAHVQATGTLETTLNQIAAEVHAAMQTGYPFALGYLFDINPSGDSAPEIEGQESETPIGRMTMTWRIDYEHSTNSTEV